MAIAYILVILQPGKHRDAMTAVKALPGIERAVFVTGKYDLVAEINANDIGTVFSIIARLEGVDGVEEYDCLIEMPPD